MREEVDYRREQIKNRVLALALSEGPVDQRQIDLLQSDGWQVHIVWECETSDVHTLNMDERATGGGGVDIEHCASERGAVRRLTLKET